MSKPNDIIDTGVEVFLNGSLQKPAPYYAKVLETLSNGKGCWESLRIGIFDRTENKIGEYVRNYSSAFRTFHPFKLRGNWYALYSKDYTATRLMQLPSCEDIGGEERTAWGFCPTDFWVPPLHYIEFIHDAECPRLRTEKKNADFTKPCSCPYDDNHHVWRFPDRVHGFVAGCVWGDDSSWKIQYLDLSCAAEGILSREERFGYIELPESLTLDKAVSLYIEEGHDLLRIAVQKDFELKSGMVRVED